MKSFRESLAEVRSLETHPLVKKARKAHKDGVWDGNVDKNGNPIVHINGRPHTVVMENYNQDLTLATKNVARLSNKETGQDKKDYQAVSRALAQGNLGAVKKVIKGISTKEIQADILNVLVGYNDLIAKMYPKAMSGGKFKSGMTVDKMVKEDAETIEERMSLDRLKKKFKKDIDNYNKRNKDLPKNVEKALQMFAIKNGEIKTDDPEEFDDWLMQNIEEATIEEARMPMYKQTKFEGKEFDRKKEIKSLKNMQKALHKLAKMQDDMQYTAETGGTSKDGNPNAIYQALVECEWALFAYMGGIERGKWDGTIDMDRD
jgi:hypothetical protein